MKNLNLSFFNNLDDKDRILLNHVGDFVNLASEKYITKFSFFLNQKQCVLCEKLLNSLKFDNFKFYGGYNDAERKVLCVFSEYDHIAYNDFPIKSLVIRYSNNVVLTHRDILGSLMSLNISRETIGDIIVSDNRAVVFAYDTISDLIKNDITKIGKTGVAVSEESVDLKKEQLDALSSNGVYTGEMFGEALLKDERYVDHELLKPYRSGGSRSDNPYVNFYWDYYAQGKPCYTEVIFPSLEKTIQLINDHGGVAVLAHPGNN